MSPEFLLANLIVCLAPGLGVIYTLSVSLGSGLRAGAWAALGCTLATVFHLGVALAGLAAVLHTSALLFQAIKLAGAAYLLWMAWTTLSGTGALAISPEPRAASPLRIVRRGVLLNLLNPKLPLFFQPQAAWQSDGMRAAISRADPLPFSMPPLLKAK